MKFFVSGSMGFLTFFVGLVAAPLIVKKKFNLILFVDCFFLKLILFSIIEVQFLRIMNVVNLAV